VYGKAQLIVKVKEPVEGELALLRKDHLLFCYLHLAANLELMQRLQEIGLTTVAFETVEEGGGALPLLAPMSNIAGRLAIQIGTHLLHRPQGGKGILLGGLPGAERGKVVVVGAGVVGGNATAVAAALGTEVTVFDRKLEKLEQMRALGNNVTGLYPYADALRHAIGTADLVIGAVLVTGARTPHVVTTDMVRAMQPGSVIVDVSVDQGGCVETTHPTTYADPTYVWEGVVHFAVTNMPGAVPRSASQVLSAAVLPYVYRLADGTWEGYEPLRRAVNVQAGEVVYPALRREAGLA
jgi:alanine dehydrogenase